MLGRSFGASTERAPGPWQSPLCLRLRRCALPEEDLLWVRLVFWLSTDPFRGGHSLGGRARRTCAPTSQQLHKPSRCPLVVPSFKIFWLGRCRPVRSYSYGTVLDRYQALVQCEGARNNHPIPTARILCRAWGAADVAGDNRLLLRSASCWGRICLFPPCRVTQSLSSGSRRNQECRFPPSQQDSQRRAFSVCAQKDKLRCPTSTFSLRQAPPWGNLCS